MSRRRNEHVLRAVAATLMRGGDWKSPRRDLRYLPRGRGARDRVLPSAMSFRDSSSG